MYMYSSGALFRLSYALKNSDVDEQDFTAPSRVFCRTKMPKWVAKYLEHIYPLLLGGYLAREGYRGASSKKCKSEKFASIIPYSSYSCMSK